MQLNEQLRSRRKALGWSQETLAIKAYVSRQTISNWENGHTYPDIESLLLLSQLFDCSLDELVKGDLIIMDDMLNHRRFRRLATLLGIGDVVAVFGFAPIVKYAGFGWGFASYCLLLVLVLCLAIHIDNLKKRYGLETYGDIKRVLAGQPPRHDKEAPWAAYLKVFGALIGTLALMGLTYWFFFTVLP
jgi:transcriptional regulator with XRE-family HTH domain